MKRTAFIKRLVVEFDSSTVQLKTKSPQLNLNFRADHVAFDLFAGSLESAY